MSENNTPAATPLDMSIYGNVPRKPSFQLSETKRKGYEDISAKHKEYSTKAALQRREDNVAFLEEYPMTISDELLRLHADRYGLDDAAMSRIFGNVEAIPPTQGDERIKERLRTDLRGLVLKTKSKRAFPNVDNPAEMLNARAFESTTNAKYSYEENLAQKSRYATSQFGNISSRDNLY